jgi:RIO kinase 1
MTKHNLNEWWQELDQTNRMEVPLNPASRKKTRKSRLVEPASADQDLQAMAELENHSDQFDFTYQASRSERFWLLDSLGDFYTHHWIEDVLRLVKSGKEASVYLCRSNTAIDQELNAAPELQSAPPLLAAKVYRPRMLRNLKNDALYREGRTDLDENGNEILKHREQRAIHKRTDFGQHLRHISWIEHEYATLQRLSQAGLDVPKAYISDSNAILMDYIGEEGQPAPVLASVRLERDEAQELFERVVWNIDQMLAHDRIHADLSAFNILYWDGQITLIDFPQAISCEQNRSAYRIFERDVTRICEYFTRQGVTSSPHSLAAELWTAHRHRLEPEIPIALLDEEDERDAAYWKSLQQTI